MSSDIYTTATALAVLGAGRTPVWATQADAGSTAPPSLASSGVALQQALRTLVHVSLREAPHRRTARLTIPTLDLGDVYNVVIDGTTVGHDASSGDVDLEDTITGIAAAINADGTVGALVTATPVESDPGVSGIDTVLIVGDGEADFSVDFTSPSLTAVLACVADLAHATARLWWLVGARPGSSPPTLWAASGDEVAVGRRGYVERFDSAGLDRLFVQLSERAGVAGDGSIVTYPAPVISIGPCLAENS